MKKIVFLLMMTAIAASAMATTCDDIVVYRVGTWYMSHNPGPTAYYQAPGTGAAPVTSGPLVYGLGTATALVGDINGDGFDDAVVAQNAVQGFFAAHSVANGGVPTQGDLSKVTTSVTAANGTAAGSYGVFLADVNGDGIDDAVNVEGGGFAWSAHHSTTSGLSSATQSSLATWGGAGFGDTPLMGDFNGDGCADAALYRPGGTNDWYVNLSNSSGLGSGVTKITDFGLATDIPLVGDIDGDGRDDGIVVRTLANGTLSWLAGFSDTTGAVGGDGISNWANFGNSTAFGDVPIVADINGDGLTDIGVKRGNQYLFAFTGAGGVLSAAVGDQFAFGFATDQVMFGDFGVVPEPATMILLGLGGLTLLRRKRN